MPTPPVKPIQPHVGLVTKLARDFFALTVLLLVVASAATWYFVYWVPANSEMAAAADEAGEAVAAREQKLELAKQHAAFLQSLTPAEQQRLAVAMPETASQADLLVSFTALAEQVGVSVESFTVGEPGQLKTLSVPATGGSVVVQPVSATATLQTPSYEVLKSLMAAIATNIPLLDITSVAYNSTTGEVALAMMSHILPQ